MPTPATGSGWERGANGVSQTPDRKETLMDIAKGIRPLDYVLTFVMVALAVLIGLENVNAGAATDIAHPLDSHSALMVPVFVAAALPILWRRRGILAAIGVSFLLIAASVPAFGWVTRCGFACPCRSRWRMPWPASPGAGRTSSSAWSGSSPSRSSPW